MNKGFLFIFIIVLCSMFGQFSTEVYLPSMPSMAKYFHVPISGIQLTITTYTLGFSIGSLFCGYFSDNLGRLKVIFPCLVLSIIGGIMCCIANSLNTLLIGRLIEGIGLGGVSVVTRSIIRDISTNSTDYSKFASILGSASAVAIALAPIIGGYIEKYLFWRINFVLLFVLSFVLAWLCKFKLQETNNFRGKIKFISMLCQYIEVMKTRKFLLYNFSSSLSLAGIVSYQTVSSFLLQVQVGLSPVTFGYTSLFITLTLVIGSIVNSKIVERRGINTMIKFGVKIYAISGLLYIIGGLFNLVGLLQIIIPMMLFSFAAGIVYPNASSGALSLFTANKAGVAASIYNCFQMLGATFGSWIISSIVQKTQLPLGVMFVFIGMSGIIICYNISNLTTD